MKKNDLKDLMGAIENNDIISVQHYLRRNKSIVNEECLHNNTIVSPLGLACHHSFLDIVDLLLKKGADINIKTMSISNTQIYLALEKLNMPLVELLLLHGADPHLMNIWGETTLSLTTSENKPFIKEFLQLCDNSELKKFKEHKIHKLLQEEMLDYIDKLISKNNLEKKLKSSVVKTKKTKV